MVWCNTLYYYLIVNIVFCTGKCTSICVILSWMFAFFNTVILPKITGLSNFRAFTCNVVAHVSNSLECTDPDLRVVVPPSLSGKIIAQLISCSSYCRSYLHSQRPACIDAAPACCSTVWDLEVYYYGRERCSCVWMKSTYVRQCNATVAILSDGLCGSLAVGRTPGTNVRCIGRVDTMVAEAKLVIGGTNGEQLAAESSHCDADKIKIIVISENL